METRATRTAGYSPAPSAATSAVPSATARSTPSSRIRHQEGAVGSTAGTTRRSTSMPPSARPRARSAAPAPTTAASASIWPARRSGPAPSARRTAASWVRAAPRTSSRPATFTQARTSTSSTLPRSTRTSRWYSLPIHRIESGRTSGTSSGHLGEVRDAAGLDDPELGAGLVRRHPVAEPADGGEESGASSAREPARPPEVRIAGGVGAVREPQQRRDGEIERGRSHPHHRAGLAVDADRLADHRGVGEEGGAPEPLGEDRHRRGARAGRPRPAGRGPAADGPAAGRRRARSPAPPRTARRSRPRGGR